MNQVLVTGGAGFIGSHLIEALLARGDRVVALDDESTGRPANLATVRDHFEFTYVRGDAGDADLVGKLVADADQVYHLAAAVGVRLVDQQPIQSIERNIRPTQTLLAEISRAADSHRPVKFFLASSSEVYGKNPRSRWTEEDDLVLGPTTRSRWSYGASKAIDEFLALAYYRQQELPVVVGRFFNVVGPRQTGKHGMVLPRFVEAALAGRPPLVHDDGAQTRCFAHVSDVCQMVLALMDSDDAIGEVVNIGGDEPISILALAERVTSAIDASLDIEFESYAAAYSEDFEDVRNRVPDLAKLRKLISYQPRYDLDDAIREVIQWKRGG
jgi:UDP-glucose 4-epimerase